MHLHTVAGPHWQRRLWRTSIVNILIHRQACWYRRTLKGRLERFFPDDNTVDIGFGEAALKRPGVKGWHSEEELSGVKSALMWYFCSRRNFEWTKKGGEVLSRSEGRVYYGWCRTIWAWVDSTAAEGWWIARFLDVKKDRGAFIMRHGTLTKVK